MRTLTSPVQIQNTQNAQRTFWLVDVTLRADGAFAAENYYFSTQGVTANGHFYEPALKEKPRINNSLGSATDGGSLLIDNTDLDFGQKVLTPGRYIEGSPVVIWFAWQFAGGSFAVDKVFTGLISEAPVSTSNNTVALKIVGDIYNPKVTVGAFPLAQRCVAPFNVNGLLSASQSLCGWQTAQGGDPLACGKTEDDCISHNNLHRIIAIPFFANVTVTPTASNTNIGSDGFDNNNHSCFANETPILLPDGTEKKIVEFKVGDAITSFNPLTGSLEPDFVEQVHVHQVTRIIELEFADGTVIETTPEHPFYLGNGLFCVAGRLEVEKKLPIVVGNSLQHFAAGICRLVGKNDLVLSESIEVRNLSVLKNKTYVVAKRGVHNVKPILPNVY